MNPKTLISYLKPRMMFDTSVSRLDRTRNFHGRSFILLSLNIYHINIYLTLDGAIQGYLPSLHKKIKLPKFFNILFSLTVYRFSIIIFLFLR